MSSSCLIPVFPSPPSGLKAAQSFFSRYCAHLEELDLKPLLTFTPLQETLEKFGTVSELFDRESFTVMEYLRQAPAKEMRLFIWTLESNRERYHTCHSILDQYFEDGTSVETGDVCVNEGVFLLITFFIFRCCLFSH